MRGLKRNLFAGEVSSIENKIKALLKCNVHPLYVLEHKDRTTYHNAGDIQEVFTNQITLGRDTSCGVRFDDSWSTVSGTHASIEIDGNCWRLIHLSKTNKTYVNGKIVETQWYLQDSDEIRLSVDGPRVVFKTIKKTREWQWGRLLYCGLLLAVFLVGLLIPSPFYQKNLRTIKENDTEELTDTINMVLGGGTYSGSVIKNTCVRNGYGRYETGNGSVYEGNWANDRLIFGTRTTPYSVYTGHFDSDLNNDGFGIVKYSDAYIKGKEEQGLADFDITVMYVGNWSKNNKQGLGRSIKKDGSMDFGRYLSGEIQKTPKANFRVGGNVYGIDISHFQKDIDWDNLALFCDRNGNAYSNNPKEKVFMQPIFFAYIKATEGATVRDEMFSVRMTEAERHGIVKGAYHFLRLGSSVEDQLKNFLETATWTYGDLPPALDIEVEAEIKRYGVERLQSMSLEWLERIEDKMGVRPIIYTREDIRNKYLNNSMFEKYQFWIARYSSKGPENFDWLIWQQTEKGQISGHKGNIDINIFRGNYDSFRKYVNQN